MILQLDHAYKTATGHIIPRSHFKKHGTSPYAIIEVMERTTDHFTASHKILTKKQIGKLLGISAKEIIDII